MSSNAIDEHWRVGRKLGRTIYRQSGDEASNDDLLLGLMETRELAAYVVELHEASLHADSIGVALIATHAAGPDDDDDDDWLLPDDEPDDDER